MEHAVFTPAHLRRAIFFLPTSQRYQAMQSSGLRNRRKQRAFYNTCFGNQSHSIGQTYPTRWTHREGMTDRLSQKGSISSPLKVGLFNNSQRLRYSIVFLDLNQFLTTSLGSVGFLILAMSVKIRGLKGDFPYGSKMMIP